jgi:hypothetical protein
MVLAHTHSELSQIKPHGEASLTKSLEITSAQKLSAHDPSSSRSSSKQGVHFLVVVPDLVVHTTLSVARGRAGLFFCCWWRGLRHSKGARTAAASTPFGPRAEAFCVLVFFFWRRGLMHRKGARTAAASVPYGHAPGSEGPSGPRRRKQSRGPHRSRRQPTPLTALRCGARLARRPSPPRRPTPAVRSEGGGGAHPPVPFGLPSPKAHQHGPWQVGKLSPGGGSN